MSVLLYAERSSWLQLPASFPTETGQLPREWENEVVAGMREAWRGAMDSPGEEAVREALRFGLRRVRPDDSVTLQYWPTASIANAVVHVIVRDFGPDEQPIGIPLDRDVPYVTQPVIEPFVSDILGTGVEVRVLGTSEEDPDFAVGSVSFLFENPRGFVLVVVDATLPQLLGMMLDPLREVVRSIRVTNDEDGTDWEEASFDPSTIPARGDEWGIPETRGAEQR